MDAQNTRRPIINEDKLVVSSSLSLRHGFLLAFYLDKIVGCIHLPKIYNTHGSVKNNTQGGRANCLKRRGKVERKLQAHAKKISWLISTSNRSRDTAIRQSLGALNSNCSTAVAFLFPHQCEHGAHKGGRFHPSSDNDKGTVPFQDEIKNISRWNRNHFTKSPAFKILGTTQVSLLITNTLHGLQRIGLIPKPSSAKGLRPHKPWRRDYEVATPIPPWKASYSTPNNSKK